MLYSQNIGSHSNARTWAFISFWSIYRTSKVRFFCSFFTTLSFLVFYNTNPQSICYSSRDNQDRLTRSVKLYCLSLIPMYHYHVLLQGWTIKKRTTERKGRWSGGCRKNSIVKVMRLPGKSSNYLYTFKKRNQGKLKKGTTWGKQELTMT